MDDLPFSKGGYYAFFWEEYRMPTDHLDSTDAWVEAVVDLVYFRFELTSETLCLLLRHGHYS